MLEEPRVIKEGWAYIDRASEKWVLKPDSPEWAKEEFNEIFNKDKREENGNIRLK